MVIYLRFAFDQQSTIADQQRFNNPKSKINIPRMASTTGERLTEDWMF